MNKKLSMITTKRLAWSAFAACVGCCALPVLAIAFGFTSIAVLGVYFEQAALGFFIAALSLFLYLVYKNKQQRLCKTDCACKGAAADKT